MSDQDSDNQTPKEEVLGYLDSLEWAASKYVQHVPTTLDGFLQLDVILHEGTTRPKRSHAQFLETFRRTFSVPSGASITSAARDLYTKPVQWICAVVCTLFDEFAVQCGVLFDDPTALKRLLAEHLNLTLAESESIIRDVRVTTWEERPPIFVRRRNALMKYRAEKLRAVMSSTGDSTKTQLKLERQIMDTATKLHVAILAS
ncbi:hypothetical protein VE00_09915 [Pseudogymnoascus sp. WSF 3629]|nr:hypothetical protein VE00_09915 [Pseudogymnoascus sp. WSF 3629]